MKIKKYLRHKRQLGSFNVFAFGIAAWERRISGGRCSPVNGHCLSIWGFEKVIGNY
jgi:hypothetical protein